MKRNKRMIGTVLALAVVAVVAIGVASLLTATPTAAVCIHRTDCTSAFPQVLCSDGGIYQNICVAQANCQYSCVGIVHQN